MRTFVAIKIVVNQELEEAIYNLHFELKEERIRWVNLNNLHLTLFFLGETLDSQINPITSGLKRIIEKSGQMSISLSGMGLFRNFRDPRVIWIGIEDNPALQELQSRIQDQLVGFGYRKDDRPFRQHLTIGRPKGIKNKKKLMEEIEKNKNRFMQESIIEEVIFYESILKERAPEYRTIERYRLKRGSQT